MQRDADSDLPQRLERFVVRGQAGRFRIVDIWTGETATIAMTAQERLSEEDAWHTAGLLNRQADGSPAGGS